MKRKVSVILALALVLCMICSIRPTPETSLRFYGQTGAGIADLSALPGGRSHRGLPPAPFDYNVAMRRLP